MPKLLALRLPEIEPVRQLGRGLVIVGYRSKLSEQSCFV